MQPVFSDLLGKTLKQIQVSERKEVIDIFTEDGEHYQMHHAQDCCECVSVEDVCGDLNALLGSPILQAEETINDAASEYQADSGTWTFYKLATIKGAVTIRWYGGSNGYYSESVDFIKIS